MNNSASASRRTWNRVMNALVWASAVLVIVLVAGILGMVLVRGIPHIDGAELLAHVPQEALGALDADTAWMLLQGFGIGGSAELPDAQAPLMALIEALPAPVAERLLVELLARLVEPRE